MHFESLCARCWGTYSLCTILLTAPDWNSSGSRGIFSKVCIFPTHESPF